MTEEERERIINAKADVTAWLASEDIGSYHLRKISRGVETYVKEVAAHPEAHNVYEQLAVRRFLRMVDKYGVNLAQVQVFFRFYESLYFPGKAGMQRYKLTPVQEFQFANIFGFWEDGKRVVREAVLYVPRKFSKTTSSASLAVYDLLFGDANAESYTGANSQDQAKKCFDAIRGCVLRLDPNERRYAVNEMIIKSRRKDRQAFCQCLTANARTKDGLNASTVIMDEFSQAKDATLLNVLTTSMGVRENPLTMIITTASDVFTGPFYSMLQGYKKVLLGEVEDDSLFAHIFEPDLDDPEGEEATWRKVHPHMGVTVSMDFYREEWKKAQRNGAEAMLAFRTKLLNVYAENARKSWLPASLAREVSVPLSIDKVKGLPEAMVAIDLSERGDFSAVTTGIYDSKEKKFYFITDYFFPEGALAEFPNEALYRGWAADGHLRLTKGNVIDYREIVNYIIKEVGSKVKIRRIGYDRWKANQVVLMLASKIRSMNAPADYIIKDVSQTYGNFNSAVETFEHGIRTGHIFINDNPINAYCFGNAVLDIDRMENAKPIKRSESQRIDGLITMLMSMRLYLDEES